jgi:phenylacetic acid degradation operon negative regulatory protein
MKSTVGNSLECFTRQRMSDGQISATSLVFTFFCDVVTQHGGEVWLGSVIQTLEPLGINERLTRTAVFRLVKDGWLESRKQGRRSYYRLTQTGQNYYQRAAQRIYAMHKPEWHGDWSLCFTALVPENKRETLNRGLLWLGYGRMATTVFALPCYPHPELKALLVDLGLQDSVILMRAEADSAESLKKLVLTHWKLDGLRAQYSLFIGHYLQAQKILRKAESQSAHSMLLLRIVLVHEYRKILLSDPELPAAMLPADWEGFAAQSLTGNLYKQLSKLSSNWAKHELIGANGLTECDDGTLAARFAD